MMWSEGNAKNVLLDFHELSPFVPRMDVSTILEQVLYSADPVEASGKVERSGVPPLRVTAVDVVWRAQTLEGEGGGEETRIIGRLATMSV